MKSFSKSALRSLAVAMIIGPACNAQIEQSDSLDLLDYSTNKQKTHKSFPVSYQEALTIWKSVEDIHDWMGNNFTYDMERARLLSNNNKVRGMTSILSPEELYGIKKGVCLDISRFAYETTQTIQPSIDIWYLKIAFEPVIINGNKFVNHWLVAYKKDEEYYFFADSKRPEKIVGPYDTVEAFISEYEKFRKREIKSFSLRDSYKKSRKFRTGQKTKLRQKRKE